jgi:hypothetical protein
MGELHTDNTIDREIKWPPENPGDMVNFFFAQELSSEDFRGYSKKAEELVESLDLVSRAVVSKTDYAVPLTLKPGETSGVMHANEMTPASYALREAAFLLTAAEPVVDQTTEVNPYGAIVWQGRHLGTAIHFIEFRGHDDNGDFTELSLSSTIPEGLLPAAAEDKKKMFMQVSSDIEALGQGAYDIQDLKAA